MELSPREIFTFTITMQELRLICQALGGRLKDEDVEPAKALDLQIARSRVMLAEQKYGEMLKLKANLPEEP